MQGFRGRSFERLLIGCWSSPYRAGSGWIVDDHWRERESSVDILLVEDDPAMLNFVRDGLLARGHR